jgi:hypothetical protein
MHKKISELIAQINPEAIVIDGMDTALIGLAYRCGISPVVCYDKTKCAEIVMKEHSLSYNDAMVWLEENVFNVYAGIYTPIFIQVCIPTYNL